MIRWFCRRMRFPILVFWAAFPLSWSRARAQDSSNYPTIGEVVMHDSALAELIDPEAKIEVLGMGFSWSEGPVWVAQEDPEEQGGFLLFSDIPKNSVMKWQEGAGVSVYLKPSGYTGVIDYGAEPGSNGLLLDPEGHLVSCEHGDRRISVMLAGGGKKTLVDSYLGRRLNSPNDACYNSNGDLYFTDPPYGLPARWEDEQRELDFCGVYRLGTNGVVTLLTDEMTRPNGIAFSVDEKTLYVAQSDPEAMIWMAFPVKEDGTLGEGRVFADATDMRGKYPGAPDGLKVDRNGFLFATGPGGVHVFNAEGRSLGRIDTGERIANVAWGNDGSVLYMTSDSYLCRLQTKTLGAGWE